MTCAKVRVICRLIATDGSVFEGENACDNPQSVCPRAPGEDYTKCKTICKQGGHAEIMALQAAGDKAKGAKAELLNHTHFCKDCQIALFGAGVVSLGLEKA